MPTFERCDKSVEHVALSLLGKYEDHAPLLAVEVKIDFVFAYADTDEKTGRPLNEALTKNGIRALGVTRILPLKDRVMGRGDAEIALDGDHWKVISAEEQTALLDHELHHLSLKTDKHGNVKYDDINRPQLQLRKHDVEVGWFSVIAQRHGAFSVEQKQAKAIMDNKGQFYWPDVAPTVQITAGATSVTVPVGTFAKAAAQKI